MSLDNDQSDQEATTVPEIIIEPKMSKHRAKEFIDHICRDMPIKMSDQITNSHVRTLSLIAFDVAGDGEIDRAAFMEKLFSLYPDTGETTFSKDEKGIFVDQQRRERRLGLGIPGHERSIQLTSKFFDAPGNVPFRQGDTIAIQRAVIIHALTNVFIDAEKRTGVGQVPILNAALERVDKQYPLEGRN